MAIVPDTKSWTWVLDRSCPECGLDTRTVAPSSVAGIVRDVSARWQDLLAGRSAEQLRLRRSDDRWSDLEYACHVRDVFRLYDERLRLMLDGDDPTFPNWDQDATAVADRYLEQDPATVAAELGEAGGALAHSFAGVTGEEWQRTGRRSDGARFTVATFARYFVHDPVHHLHDVGWERRR
jgi:hypothetical protein